MDINESHFANQYLKELLSNAPALHSEKRTEFFETADKLNLFSTVALNVTEKKRMETRSRKQDPETAISFAVHDPLWMLTRQWQFGEFKGNDAGSAIWAKIKIKHTDVSGFQNKAGNTVNGNRAAAMEYYVERINQSITEGVKVEAAYHLKKMLGYSTLGNKMELIINFWREKFPLSQEYLSHQNPMESSVSAKDALARIKFEKNTSLNRFMAAFAPRAFDGYAIFTRFLLGAVPHEELLEPLSGTEKIEMKKILLEYCNWFKSTYLPIEEGAGFWNDEELGYDLDVRVQEDKLTNSVSNYSAEDYHSGRLSWYSFDKEKAAASPKKAPNLVSQEDQSTQTKYFSFVPVSVGFQGAPNKRLWAFEDAKVVIGNSGLASSDLASAMVMQFTTLFSNDWLITPLELEVGRISSVEGILVTDVFGKKYYIDRPVGGVSSKESRFSSRWELFTIAQKNAYIQDDFSTDGRLFYPASLPRTEESESIEEVQFLRDEMANMVWGVELKLNDGCGHAINGVDLAAEVEGELKRLTLENEEFEEELEADYAYLFQNGVPLNWIPYSPVRFERGTPNFEREIRLQRSAMPIFLKNQFVPIRPNTQLLRKGINDKDEVKAYGFINEEEILSVGTKISLNFQRTRWFNGKTYSWLGAKKEIKRMQANSGLTFDELVELIKKNNAPINLNRTEE